MAFKLKPTYVVAAFLGFSTFPVVASAIPLPAAAIPSSVSRAPQDIETAQTRQPNLEKGAMATPSYQAAPTSPGAEKVTFVLKKLVISGSTIYGNQALEQEFSRFIGKKISLATLQQITNAITLQYRKDGYILSKAIIPAQKIDNGVVQLQVIEGYIAGVEIQGNAKGARPLLEAYGKRIEADYPLNIKALERFALLANDIPGMNVKTILQPLPPGVAATKGGVNLVFIPAQSTASGYVSYDNRGTKFLGPNEFSAGASVNSIFRPGDQTGFQGVMTKTTNELQYLNVYTRQPLGSNGVTLNVSGSVSHTEPGFTLKQFGIKGNSSEVTTTLNAPVIRSRQQNLFLTGTFDYLDNSSSQTELLGSDISDQNLYTDHVRSLRLGANYYLNDRFAGMNQFGLQVSKGLPVLGSSPSDSSHLSRIDGDPQYTKLNANISRLQVLPHSFSIYTGVIGQYGFNPLLSAEQFSYGGSQYGQAFDPSEITGDKGVAAKAELRYDQTPNWRFLNTLEYFGGYDIGKVWNIEPESVNGLPKEQSGASVYGGLRTTFNQFVSGNVEIAQPLTRLVATENGGRGGKAPRIFFSVTLSGDTPASVPTANTTTTAAEQQQGKAADTAPTGYANGSATNGPDAQWAAAQ